MLISYRESLCFSPVILFLITIWRVAHISLFCYRVSTWYSIFCRPSCNHDLIFSCTGIHQKDVPLSSLSSSLEHISCDTLMCIAFKRDVGKVLIHPTDRPQSLLCVVVIHHHVYEALRYCMSWYVALWFAALQLLRFSEILSQHKIIVWRSHSSHNVHMKP